MIKQIKFPTVLGLGVLIVGLVGGLLLVRQEQQLASKAAEGGAVPRGVTISNISDRGFTVSWTTATTTTGFLMIEQEGQDARKVVDDRDRQGTTPITSTTHYASVDALEPTQGYRFRVGTGANSVFDQNGSPYAVTTAPALTDASAPDSAQGLVLTSTNAPGGGAIVYTQFPQGQLLSTLVTSSGNWILPLSTMRQLDLTAWLSYDKNLTIYELKVNGGVEGLSEAILTTAGDRPTPPIILGQTYDFRQGRAPLQKSESTLVTPIQTPVSASPTVSAVHEEGSTFSFSSLGAVRPLDTEVTLENPHRDGEVLQTLKPEFFGRGPAGISVEVIIESSQAMSGTTAVAQTGNWTFSPLRALAPGEHMITLRWKDAQGVIQTLTRSFVVSASTGPAFTSTESATPTLAIPSPTPTAEVPLSPTPTLRAALPTSSPTPSPTRTPPSSLPATESGTPNSGNLTPSVLLFMMGVVLTLLGVAFMKVHGFYGR